MIRKTLRFSVLPLAAVAGLFLGQLWLDHRAMARFSLGQETHRPETVDLLGPLPAELVESSGLGVSRRHPGVLWTHNDSGDRPRFYAVDLRARLLATYDVLGAAALDWEDMALAPCPAATEAAGPLPQLEECLFLADTGDNGLHRDTLTIYVVPEPDLADAGREATPLGRLRFRYPDGAHDVEGVAVGPEGDLVLVTKGRTGEILLFGLPAEGVAGSVRADTVVELPQGRVLPIDPDWRIGRVVTGTALNPDGGTLVVRTYSELFFLPWPLPDDLESAHTTCFLGTLEPSGEAVDWEDATTLLLTSETSSSRGQGMLTRVRCAGALPG